MARALASLTLVPIPLCKCELSKVSRAWPKDMSRDHKDLDQRLQEPVGGQCRAASSRRLPSLRTRLGSERIVTVESLLAVHHAEIGTTLEALQAVVVHAGEVRASGRSAVSDLLELPSCGVDGCTPLSHGVGDGWKLASQGAADPH